MRLKINILLLIFALLFNIDAAFAKNIAHRDGDVLVIFKGEEGERVTAASLKGVGRDALRAASIASENGAWVKGIYNNLSQAGNGVFALIHSDILSADELVSELLERPDVIAASPNYIVRAAAVPNDTATPSNNNRRVSALGTRYYRQQQCLCRCNRHRHRLYASGLSR